VRDYAPPVNSSKFLVGLNIIYAPIAISKELLVTFDSRQVSRELN